MPMMARTGVYLLCAAVCLLEAWYSIRLQSEVLRNGDIAMHLSTAERIVRGDELYRDIITTGFPMQFYLRVPGVLLARGLGLDIISVAVAFDNLVALLSLALTLCILRKTPLGRHLPGLCFLAVVLGFAMFVLPFYGQNIMGQKEYFFWLFTLPYFTLAAAGGQNIGFPRGFRVLIGCLSALGFCYKPSSILPLLLVEAYLCWSSGTLRTWLRAEFLSCVLLGIAYLIWMQISLPGYRTTILPLARFYSHMRPEYSSLAYHYARHLLPFILPAVVLWGYLRYKRSGLARFFDVYLLSLVGYVLACLVQTKEFLHHLFPSLAMGLTLLAAGLVALWIRPSQPDADTPPPAPASSRFTLAFALACLALIGLVEESCVKTMDSETPQNPDAILNRAFELRQETGAAHPPLYTLSIRAAPMFPQGVYRGLPWDYRFYHLWLLSGIQKYKQRHRHMPPEWVEANTRDAEAFLREVVTEDMERLQPTLLLVDKSGSIDFVGYFSVHPRFAALMKGYVFQEHFRGMDIYVKQPKSRADLEQVPALETFAVGKESSSHGEVPLVGGEW